MSFLSITRVRIPLANLETVYGHLRKAGEDGMEGIALLFGNQTDDIFDATTVVVPKQKAYRTEQGLLYHVDGEELHTLNVWAYRTGLSLFAQIHSHPQEAYHSDTDDQYAIITTLGGLSIVVPNFAVDPINPQNWAVYRLLPQTGWTVLESYTVADLLQLV